MSVKKIILLAVAAIFLATPALADNQPEYEALCDWQNIFAQDGQLTYGAVTENCRELGFPYNEASLFPGEYFEPPITTGQAKIDFCFTDDGAPYWSYRAEPQVPATWEWRFKLQMMPESDINVNIYDCVLKPQGTDIFTQAQQTGRMNFANDGSTEFVRSMNPSITVVAEPADWDPVTMTGRFDPFVMTARRMPILTRVALDQLLYTSKAHWYEGLVLELPIEGQDNANGDTQHQLLQGDFIKVTLSVPFGHPARVAYGPDNVLLKYIGVVGTAIVHGGFRSPILCRDFDG
jgi:hypothetical protein